MIRERRAEDLGRLCVLLSDMGRPEPGLSTGRLREWLVGDRVEVSWVFDQAPVPVTPTKNVVGHVQICRPDPTERCLVIDRLFVRPGPHEVGITRYLLTEAVKHIRREEMAPVLCLRWESPHVRQVAERLGLRETPSHDSGLTLMAGAP